jgi:hypothetical protein
MPIMALRNRAFTFIDDIEEALTGSRTTSSIEILNQTSFEEYTCLESVAFEEHSDSNAVRYDVIGSYKSVGVMFTVL